MTHFLGQAAQQRFTSRDPHDQWQALKGPSGIDRLERIRAGLRGRPTVMAFNRRIETEQASVTAIERQIADWQGWMTRLERLRAAARATGVLTAAEVSERIDQLEADLLQLTSGQPLPITGENVARRLATMSDRIGEALRLNGDRKTALETLAPLAAQFAISRAGSLLDAPALVRLRSVLSDAQAQVDRVSPLVTPANNAVTTQQAAIATIEQNIAILEAGRTDLARRMQLAELIAADGTDRAQLIDAIAARRATIAGADQAIAAHAVAVNELARLRSLASTAKAQDESMRDYLDLESDAGMTAGALTQGREAAERAAADVAPLETQLADLETRIANAEHERAEADRHATAISAALSQLASHLHEDDTDCPLCRTPFEPGVLKALADAAAAGSDGRLAQADEAVERLRTLRADLATKISTLRLPIDAVEKLQLEAEAAQRAVIDARAAIALALGVPEGSDYVAITATRRREAESAVATAEAALELQTTGAAVATQQRTSAASDLDDLIGRESQLGMRLSQFQAEDTRVDATSFGMALRYRERVENALEMKKDLPPQVVLSEGQLAANGFSILCAASTAYPWSRWRALLLDDPLQHNDIIHTAAFVDLMRNMVELNGYQLVMSSHDRGESDFIARKFDAAGLPCSTVLLTAPSQQGVAWEKPEHNQAAARIMRRDSKLSTANTA